jgi:hypothetical protein
MTVFASAAEACISCEHVPVVARSSTSSHSAKRYTKKRVYRSTKKRVYRSTKKRKSRAAKKHIVKRKTTAKKRIVTRKTTAKKRIVKRKTTAKKVETAKTAPIKSEIDNQNSTTSTASLDNDEPKTSSYVGCKTSGNTLSVGCVVAKARPSEMTKNLGRLSVLKQPDRLVSGPQESKTLTRGAFKNTENLGCKRFFPAVGKTLTVPCE